MLLWLVVLTANCAVGKRDHDEIIVLGPPLPCGVPDIKTRKEKKNSTGEVDNALS
jgi:hypothetical protein